MDVKTAGRTVDLFEVFANTKAPLTLSAIARALNAPQSSCFNLVRALEARGYLYAVGGAKRIYPTRKLFDIAENIAGFEPVIPRLEASLVELRNVTHETVILGARQGLRVIYLSVIEGDQIIRYMSRAGELKPMHASAIGKALLMTVPAANRAALIEKLPVDAITEHTITAPEKLLREIEQSASRGYSLTSGENVADVMAIGRPLRLGGADYAVAVAGPIGRMTPRVEAIAERLTALTKDLEAADIGHVVDLEQGVASSS